MHYQTPTYLQAAILDWAGTVVDFGSFAPTQIFVEAFAEFGVAVSLEEARGPMGMGKWDHIRTLCDIPAIAERYRAAFGRLPTDDDVTAIYERFMPLQIAKVGEHSALIPGALEAIAALRANPGERITLVTRAVATVDQVAGGKQQVGAGLHAGQLFQHTVKPLP
eukprot:gene12774-15612_t